MSDLIFRIDDVVPGFPWTKFRPIEDLLYQFGIKPIVGVVPANMDRSLNYESENSQFWEKIREWQGSGWTIAQHGFQHIYDIRANCIMGKDRKSEFAGHEASIQTSRLESGLKILEKEGLLTNLFMAPNHAFDLITVQALTDLGFSVITDGWGYHPYKLCDITLIPQLTSTPHASPFGTQTMCVHIGPMTDSQMKRLSDCVVRNHDKFVSVDEVLNTKQNIGLVGPPLRAATSFGLSAFRFLR